MGITSMRHQQGEERSFIHRHQSKVWALLFWSAVVGLYWWITDSYNLSPAKKVLLLQDMFTQSIYGPLLFLVFFSLQPLVFFPSFILGVAGGMLYGPLVGIAYVLIGANGAANLCYLVGRFFGRGVVEHQSEREGTVRRYMDGARENTFETILILHLLFVPFDVVNYLAGFFKMNWRQFALATVLGSIPGVFTFVLFGASLEGNLLAGQPELNFTTLALAGAALVVGIILSRLVKLYERHSGKQNNPR